MSKTVNIYQWSLEKLNYSGKYYVVKKVVESIERPKTYKGEVKNYLDYNITLKKSDIGKCVKDYNRFIYSSLVDDDRRALEELRNAFARSYQNNIEQLEDRIKSNKENLEILRNVVLEVNLEK